jgi:hypothetical protein
MNSRLRPHGAGEGREREGGEGRGREGLRLRGRERASQRGGREGRGGGGEGEGREGRAASTRTLVLSVWTCWVRADAARVRTDVPIYPRGNFITDATVRPSHGRPSSHRPTVRPTVLNRPCDNPAQTAIYQYLISRNFRG